MSLEVPFQIELFDEFIAAVDLEATANEILGKLTEEQKRCVNLILRRIRLSDNILNGGLFNYLNDGVGGFEESALRLHLYLSCFELIAIQYRGYKYLSYTNWLCAKKEPYKSEKEAVLLGAKDMEPLDLLKAMDGEYRDNYGVKNAFYFYFTDVLMDSQKKYLLDNCWVMKHRPLPTKFPDLQFITTVVDERDSDDLKIVKSEKLKWEALNEDDRLQLVGEALFAARNMYTHSAVPYTSVQDQTNIRFDELYGPNSAISKDELNRGDTIFLWESNIAVSFTRCPATEYLRTLLLYGLKNSVLEWSG